jgi:hypothetical protein
MVNERGWAEVRGSAEGIRAQASWTGAAGLKAERGRLRRRLRWAGFTAVLFIFCLFQVHLCTEAAARGSRVTSLKAELTKIEVDLAVAKSRLANRQVYGTLMLSADQSGFGGGGKHRTIAMNIPAPVPENRLVDQVRGELSAGVGVLLPQALAQDLRADSPKLRARRP